MIKTPVFSIERFWNKEIVYFILIDWLIWNENPCGKNWTNAPKNSKYSYYTSMRMDGNHPFFSQINPLRPMNAPEWQKKTDISTAWKSKATLMVFSQIYCPLVVEIAGWKVDENWLDECFKTRMNKFGQSTGFSSNFNQSIDFFKRTCWAKLRRKWLSRFFFDIVILILLRSIEWPEIWQWFIVQWSYRLK